jgi:hypothetical protein
LSGVQTLLQATPPCPGGQTGSNCTGALANMHVSLFTFPNVLTSYNGVTVNSISDDLNCGGNPATYLTPSTQPIAAPYTLPVPGASLPGAPDATYLTYVETSTGKKWTATYQITPFLADYYDPNSTATGGLNASSELVQAVGYTSSGGTVHSGCLTYTYGIDGSGNGSGFGNTYFAASIYAAQSALTAEQALYSNSKNALIFLSDGQANATYYSKNNTTARSGSSGSYYGTAASSTNQYAYAYQFPEGAQSGGGSGPPATNTCTPTTEFTKCAEVGPSSLIPNTNSPAWPATPPYYTPATILPAQGNPANGGSGVGYDTLSSSSKTGVGGTYQATNPTKGLYPDWFDQCQQAIIAANYASSAGTRNYSVAYGSEASGCGTGWDIGLTDITLVATGNYTAGSLGSGSSDLPCTTMEDIASSWDYFYSDNQQTGNVNLGCTDDNHTTTSLKSIFNAIAATFTTPRLLPNNAT